MGEKPFHISALFERLALNPITQMYDGYDYKELHEESHMPSGVLRNSNCKFYSECPSVISTEEQIMILI